MRKVLLILLCFLVLQGKAQLDQNVKAEVELQAIGTTNGVVPFWMRSNQYGSVPLAGASTSAIGRISRDYETLSPSDKLYGREKTIDWGYGFEGRANGGDGSNFSLIEAYGKLKVWKFQLTAGRTRDVMGLNGDTSLSSGNFSVSGNSLGIPKIEISIPEYWTIPVFNGLISIKGNFAHGWSGSKTVKRHISDAVISPVDRVGTYLHQKSFYGRLGKKDWRFKLYGGFNHQVFWGGEKDVYQEFYTLTPLETFFYVATGKAYGNSYEVPNSKIGNQLGSIDIGAEYNFDALRLTIYRQHFYDIGALSKLANIADGLNGISISNTSQQDRRITWRSILFEFLYTKHQAGELNAKYTKSGDEDYYNNYFYTEGWTYRGIGLGTPFISTHTTVKSGQASDPRDYFINNRVVAFNLGLHADVNAWRMFAKLSFSKNFGTYGTSTIGHSLGYERFPPEYGIFRRVNQFSAYIESERNIGKRLALGTGIGFDHGRLLDNSFGAVVKLKKSFN
ncbi:capsule assembly Wzi family protein [Pedobacter faecalis]|uniref:capsule assembly Wzi family protein n=1 Tax=Pedobacter faecalis TaxID=3041495 RepID=UPI00254AC16B|nr:capsule assembly Wzi family protein [Pedobacter sp. ELA7]